MAPSLWEDIVRSSCSTRSTCRFMSMRPVVACRTIDSISRFSRVGMTSLETLMPISLRRSDIRVAAFAFGIGILVERRWAGV